MLKTGTEHQANFPTDVGFRTNSLTDVDETFIEFVPRLCATNDIPLHLVYSRESEMGFRWLEPGFGTLYTLLCDRHGAR